MTGRVPSVEAGEEKAKARRRSTQLNKDGGHPGRGSHRAVGDHPIARPTRLQGHREFPASLAPPPHGLRGPGPVTQTRTRPPRSSTRPGLSHPSSSPARPCHSGVRPKTALPPPPFVPLVTSLRPHTSPRKRLQTGDDICSSCLRCSHTCSCADLGQRYFRYRLQRLYTSL